MLRQRDCPKILSEEENRVARRPETGARGTAMVGCVWDEGNWKAVEWVNQGKNSSKGMI